MGYTTTFKGAFQFNKPLDEDTRALLDGLRKTRRMKRNLKVLADTEGLNIMQAGQRYGVDGEFYYDSLHFSNSGQQDTLGVEDHYNTPPVIQPSLWLKWKIITANGRDYLVWDGSEKFTEYVEWLEYILHRILDSRNNGLHGTVYYKGEDPEDRGVLTIQANMVIDLPFTNMMLED